MDEKFVNKCFENWKAIVEYIEKQYENLPVSRDFALDFVTKPNERTIMFELTVNTFGAVYLKSDDREHYSDFLNIFKLDDVTKAKCTDMRKKETISIFCHCIETICKDWDKIKEAITKSQEGYHAVMNFSVGRGSEKSYCVLLTQSASQTTRERLEVMCRINDGFEIAREDLRIRGPGEFFGQRQSGVPGLRIAELGADMKLLSDAHDAALALLAQDPQLSAPENAVLRSRITTLLESERT